MILSAENQLLASVFISENTGYKQGVAHASFPKPKPTYTQEALDRIEARSLVEFEHRNVRSSELDLIQAKVEMQMKKLIDQRNSTEQTRKDLELAVEKVRNTNYQK